MWQRTRDWLAPPAMADPVQEDRARILNQVLLTLPALALLAGGLIAALSALPAPWLLTRLVPVSLIWPACWFLLRRGHLVSAGVAFVTLTWLMTCAAILLSGGLTSPLLGVLLALTLVGGAVLGRKTAVVLAIVSGLALGGIAALDWLGRLSAPDWMNHPVATVTAVAVSLYLVAITVHALLKSSEGSLTVVQRANESLQEEQERQSARIAAQARVLRTSAEISRRLSTILDQGELVSAVVNQIQAAFNYYHVHVYLFDDARQNLVMVGGTGEAGRALLMGRHKVPAHKGLTGRAAKDRKPVLATDVRAHQNWLPNPLLPDTRSEAAVPILLGDEVVGILDVQQDVVDGLGQGDVEMLQLIASQLAIALQNAHSFDRARQRVRQESLVNLIGQRIQRANTVDEVLAIAAGELGDALGAGRVRATVGSAGSAGQDGAGGNR